MRQGRLKCDQLWSPTCSICSKYPISPYPQSHLIGMPLVKAVPWRLNGSRATTEERYIANWVRWPLADQQILWRAGTALDGTHSKLRHLSFEQHNRENLHRQVKGWKGHRRETRRAAVEPRNLFEKPDLLGWIWHKFTFSSCIFFLSHVIQTRKMKGSGYKGLPWCCCWQAWMQMVIVLERFFSKKKRSAEWFLNNLLRQNPSQGWAERQRAPWRSLKMKSSDCFTRQCAVSTFKRIIPSFAGPTSIM